MNWNSMFGLNVKIWVFFGFIERKNFLNVVLLSFVPFLTLILQLLELYHSWGRIFESGLIINFCTTSFLINAFLRIFTVIAKEEKFADFMETIDECCLNVKSNNDSHSMEILDERRRRARFICILNWASGILGSLVTMAFPLLAKERELPYKVMLPFGWDVHASPLYEVMFLLQIVFVMSFEVFIYVPFTNISTIWLIFGIGILRDLRWKLESLTRENYKTDRELLVALKKCITYHEYIINYKTSLEDLISWLSFFEFLLFSVMLCVLLFFILMATTLVMQVKACFYIIALFFLAFMTFWHANEFSDESRKIAGAAFNVEWTASSKELKNLILILIARSQKALTIFAGGIYPMNLETFQALLRTSYTFWTFLRNLSVK